MIDTKRLKAISELNPAQWLDGSNVSYAYGVKLIAFTDDFPAKEEALRDAVADGDIAGVTACITAIHDMLLSISADNLAAECALKISEIPVMSASGLEAFAEGFLGTISSLSIDIQMAIYAGEGREAAPPPAGTAPDFPAQAGQAAPEGEREIAILAVDDNSFFLNTIKTYLSETNYKLTCVTSGSTALRFLQKHTADLLIFDIDMPEMNGYELAEKVHEAGVTAPIIFLTGNASKDYVIKAVKAGAVDFIVKPISKEKALSKIAKYIRAGAEPGAAPAAGAPQSQGAAAQAHGNAGFKGHIR